MTQTPDQHHGRPSGPSGGRTGDGLWTWLRDLGVQRRTTDKWVAGVCSGIADRLGVDPVLVRAGFILVLIFGGFGVPLYLAAWALLPDRNGEISAENAIRHGDGKSIVLLVFVGIAVLGGLSDKWWLWFVLAPLGLFLFWVMRSAKSGKSSDEIGREASELAARLGDTVSGWASSSGPAAREAKETREAKEARERADAAGGGPATAACAGPVSPDGGPRPSPAWSGGGPHGMGPGRTGPVSAPPPRIVRDRRRRAGFLGLLLVLGLAVAGYASGTGLQSHFAWSHSTPEVFALACTLGGVGLALFIVGLTGRRAGFLTFLATLLAIAAVTGTMGQVQATLQGGLGDRTWTLAKGVPPGGFRLGAGDATLDLTGATAGQHITLQQGLGDLTILVPAGVTATIEATVGVGDLKVVDSQGKTVTGGLQTGTGQHGSADSVKQTFGTGATTVTVTAHLGAGDLTIKEQSP
ncbi:MAG: PspC domain-containing protein [Lapillicoccus sp.]